MPSGTRDLVITYGGFTVGGSGSSLSSVEMDGKFQLDLGYPEGFIQFDFVFVAADDADFASGVASIHEAFRTPRQDLLVTQGAETILSLSHSSSTGFDSEPHIVKEQDVADTRHSRRYTVRITFGMPADVGGNSPFRYTSVDVDYSPNRKRKTTISGTATAIGGTNARDKYEATIEAFAAAVLSALGGTYELAEEPRTEHNSTNKTIEFVRVYEEVRDPEPGGSPDAANIIRQQFKARRSRTAPGDSAFGGAPVERAITIEVEYSAWLEASTDMTAVYDDTIKPYILERVKDKFALIGAALMDDDPQLDFREHFLMTSMTIMGQSATQVFELTQSIEDTINPGGVLAPVWNGDMRSRFGYKGPIVRVRVITVDMKVFGYRAPTPFSPETPPFLGGSAMVRSESIKNTPRTWGIAPDTIEGVEINATKEIEFFKPFSAPGETLSVPPGGNAAAVKIDEPDARKAIEAFPSIEV